MSAKFSLSWGSGCKKPPSLQWSGPNCAWCRSWRCQGLAWGETWDFQGHCQTNLVEPGAVVEREPGHADKGRHPTSRKYYGRLERCLHQTSCAILNFNDQQKWYMTLNEQFNMSIYQVWIHRFLINLVFLGVAPQGWRILYFLGVDVEYEGWVFLEGTLLRSEWDCGCSPQHRFVALQRGGGGGALIMR